jgi:hypothetical protein
VQAEGVVAADDARALKSLANARALGGRKIVVRFLVDPRVEKRDAVELLEGQPAEKSVISGVKSEFSEVHGFTCWSFPCGATAVLLIGFADRETRKATEKERQSSRPDSSAKLFRMENSYPSRRQTRACCATKGF